MAFLGRMSIATINMPRMVEFYQRVLNATLSPVPAGKFTMYQGRMGEINITLAPNEMLGIQSENSRHQLSFLVPNLEKALSLAARTGATQMEEISTENDERYCGILDPDGNMVELVERYPQMAY